MKHGFLSALVLAVLLAATQALALDLNQARRDGLVGEKTDGYVAVVQQAPGVAGLVVDINTRRKAEYERISKQNKQPLDVVGKLAAEQIINGLPKGSLYQAPGGGWQKK